MSDENNLENIAGILRNKPSGEDAARISSNLANRGGRAENPANPDTPSFMVKDQNNPSRLPLHQPSKNVNNN